MYQGIFLNVQQNDKRLAQLMSTKGRYGLSIHFQKPTEFMTQVQQILDHQPDLLALDYRLKTHRSRTTGSYTAGALAQQLRDSMLDAVTKDFPIILVSNENDLKTFFDKVTTQTLFDRYFTKQEFENGHFSNRKVLSLVKGYKYLIKNWEKTERWSIFLRLNQSERIRVGYQAIRELGKLKAPHQVARDILRYVIDRPGLLLDQMNVLAKLGVDRNQSDVDTLFDILRQEKILYTGVFGDGWARWWRHRLEKWSEQLCDEAIGNLTAKQRISCLNKKLGLKLSPAKSRWENHADALVWMACDSCHQPTELQYSVAAYDPLPYSFVQGKRICWSCIETGEFKSQGLEIDEDEEFIVEKIQKGELKE